MPERVFILGANQKIKHTVTRDEPFSILSVSMSIWDSAGTLVVNSAAGSMDNTHEAKSHDIWYLWTPGNAGDYVYRLVYISNLETIPIRGEVSVVAADGKLSRWMDRIARWIQDSGVGDADALLTYRDYRDAALTAVREYEKVRPQLKDYAPTLATGTFDYNLPSDWENDFSTFLQVEYPVDDTSPYRQYLHPRSYEWDETIGKFRFISVSPTTGETTRIRYTAPHVLTDTTDTIPARDYDGVTQYAAGVALEMLANRAASTSAPNLGAEQANYRTKQTEYRQQAMMMMDAARKSWGGGTAAAVAVWEYPSYCCGWGW